MSTRWDELFDRAAGHDVDLDAIRTALDRRREESDDGPDDGADAGDDGGDPNG